MPNTFATTNPDAFHQQLAQFNVRRLAPATPSPQWQDELQTDLAWRISEGHFLESLRTEIAPMVPWCANGGDNFARWFELLAELGPGQQHPLFDWLAKHATLPQMRWFLTQEVVVEAGFDDLLAHTQIQLPIQAKLECARNYWDEMGHGKQGQMHGQLLTRMVHGLQPATDTTVWESLAASNIMLGLAINRRYVYQAIGALGVIELTAPLRAARIAKGMRRLGLNKDMRAYFDLHAVLDVSHAQRWIQQVIHPLVDAAPECALFIAEGALMRLLSGERCFDRYSKELQCEPFSVPMQQRLSA